MSLLEILEDRINEQCATNESHVIGQSKQSTGLLRGMENYNTNALGLWVQKVLSASFGLNFINGPDYPELTKSKKRNA